MLCTESRRPVPLKYLSLTFACSSTSHGPLVELMDARSISGAASWYSPGPSRYFTAQNPKFTPDAESHAAVTHEYNQLRLVVVPEVPKEPLHIRKERLEGTSHARAGHSRAGESQTVTLNCLWLMHGNSEPKLVDPGDLGQVDRINPVHFQLQYGDMDDPNHVWDDLNVPVANRRREDPAIKEAAGAGLFAAELFQHCCAARQCLPTSGRKIEPRPESVAQATYMEYHGDLVRRFIRNCFCIYIKFVSFYIFLIDCLLKCITINGIN